MAYHFKNTFLVCIRGEDTITVNGRKVKLREKKNDGENDETPVTTAMFELKNCCRGCTTKMFKIVAENKVSSFSPPLPSKIDCDFGGGIEKLSIICSEEVGCKEDINGCISVKIIAENKLVLVEVSGAIDMKALEKLLQKKLKSAQVKIVQPPQKNESSSSDDNIVPPQANESSSRNDNADHKPPVTTAVFKLQNLNLNLGCNKCIKTLKGYISETEGYYDMAVDAEKNLVTVTGAFDMKAFAELLTKKMGTTNVSIVPPEKAQTEDKLKREVTMEDRVHYNPYIPHCSASHMFNDENANFCRVM